MTWVVAWCLCVFVITQSVIGFHVLLIGDSVDRYIVTDWCYSDRPKPSSKLACPDCIFWFEETGSKWDSMMCVKGNDSIANVHHFGSRDSGPYFSKPVVAERDFAPNIIRRSIDRYFDRVGVPDLILYQAVLWDVAYMKTVYEGDNNNNQNNNSLHGDVGIRDSAIWNESVQVYATNIRHRIHDVQEAVNANLARLHLAGHVNIGLHTGVTNKHIGELANGFNDVLRALAFEYNITMFDLDTEVWSTYNWDRSKESFVMRDIVHPLPYFTSLAALKLLGHRYSSNLVFRGPTDWYSPRRRICLSTQKHHRYHCPPTVMKTELSMDVKLVAAYPTNAHGRSNGNMPRSHIRHRHRRQLRSSERDDHRRAPLSRLLRDDTIVYYLHQDAATNDGPERVGPISDRLRDILRLSQGDILYLPAEDIEKIPLSHLRFPPIHGDEINNVIVNTTLGHLYIYFPEKEVFRLYTSTIAGLSLFGFTTVVDGGVGGDASSSSSSTTVSCPNITQHISDQWLQELFTIGPPLPNIYYQGSLIRLSSQREVYVVLEGEKRLIPSVAVFFRYGSDWNQVQVITDIDDFNRIPTGPSL